MALTELAEKGADIDVLRQMVVRGPRLMETDVERRAAPATTRNPMRLNSRNGYRDRAWEHPRRQRRAEDPQLRQGSYFRPSGSPGRERPRRRWRP